MKRKILTIMVMVLCLSLTMSGCVFIDAIKGLVYNTETQEGYTEVVFSDTRFEVPTDIKNEAIEPVGTITMSSKEVLETTYESNTDRYALLNCSKFMVLVDPVDLSQDLSDIEDIDDFERALKLQKNELIDIDIAGTFATASISGKDKVIAGATGVLISDFGTYNFKGYVTAIENTKSEVYVLTVLTTDDTIDTEYIAKSLDFSDSTNNKPSNQNPSTSTTRPGNTPETTPSVNQEQPNNQLSNSNLKDFKFNLNKRTVQLPIKVGTFLSEFGFEIVEEDRNKVLESGIVDYIFVGNKDCEFMVGVHNPIKAYTDILDCEIFSINVYSFDVSNLNSGGIILDFVLPNSILPFNTTYEELINTYGTPTTDHNDTEYNFRTLVWELPEHENDIFSKLEIVIDTKENRVFEFSYGHFPYTYYRFK